MVFASLVSAVGNIVGSMGANSARSRAADKQNEFSLMMSNTAYQRGMEDMKKAGLNPILAYRQGPATSPGGAKQDVENELAAATANAASAFTAQKGGQLVDQSVASGKASEKQSQAQTRKLVEETRALRNKNEAYEKTGKPGGLPDQFQKLTKAQKARQRRSNIRQRQGGRRDELKWQSKNLRKKPISQSYKRAKKRYPKYVPIPGPRMRGIY